MVGTILQVLLNKPLAPTTGPLFAFIEGMGGPELMLILFIILLLFGSNKLPELAKGLGKSVREFKKASSGVEDEIRKAMEVPDEPARKEASINPPTVASRGMVAEKLPAPTDAS